MDVTDQKIFQDLKKSIEAAQSHQSHILIYSFSGSGGSYLFKSLVNTNKKLTYINNLEQDLGDFSLLDLSLDNALTLLEKANINQKTALLVGNGMDYHSPRLEAVKSHFYLKIPLSCRDLGDSTILCHEINPKLTASQIKEIYKTSQGVGKIIKYLSINPKAIRAPDNTLNQIVSETTNSITGYSSEEIDNLGIKLPLFGQGLSPLPITVNFDLTFSESGIKSSQLLTATEAKILKKIIDNKGQITKSEISDIKWGEGKYDEFSDQAINKAMRRLNQKFSRFTLITIPKIGFSLKENE